jgi:RHH-type proline utilization regulon transcriptional repressor/proline dehydrogenase/delta 1-pyrroline-5-carboxylate dehydrogenase
VVDTLDREATALARRIAELGAGERARVYALSFWSERLLSWAMDHPEFKTQLFRFVDVFPSLANDRDVARHLEEYFGHAGAPRIFELGVDLADKAPLGLGRSVSAAVARRNIRRMARQFIVGAGPADAATGLHRLWRSGSAATVDLLGERTVTEAEADTYAARVGELLDTLVVGSAGWAPDDLLEFDDGGPLPRVNLSIKPTALSPLFAPLTGDEGLEQAAARLLPILTRAAQCGAFTNFDMEQYEVKDLTRQLFRALLEKPELADLEAGIVVQAYLRDSYSDLQDLVDWSGRRARPITVRLVKGAYWDAETVRAGAHGWPSPVFTEKAQTDANYERCTRLLLDHHGAVRAAFGSHNLRSLAYAIAYARSSGIPDSGYELQMLYGMAEPTHLAVKRMGLRLRVYAPVGELVPGMAYLVRRLLENTSNESFVRHRFASGTDLDALVMPPLVESLPVAEPASVRSTTELDSAGAGPPYEPESPAEWHRAPVRAAFSVAVANAGRSDVIEVPAVIGGATKRTDETLPSVDPGRPTRLVAVSSAGGASEVDDAVGAAVDAFPRWSGTPARERAAVLWRAAAWMRQRRSSLAALEVFEAGKPWPEADADVCEAIDFCEYYGREMLRLDRGGVVQSPPGEANQLSYAAKGVGAVIAPWNFPLAIPMGMVAAALVTGNTVVFKPAEQTPAAGATIVEAFAAAGLPPGALNCVPGLGECVGAPLVRHRAVAFVIFTGSLAVGLGIIAAAAGHQPGQRSVKRVVAEMGGKNAIVVDADADLDQVIPAVVASAFGFAGQKCSACSRLIVVDPVADALVDRLVGAARMLTVGHPERMHVTVGPLIDADAHARVNGVVDAAADAGRVVLRGADVPPEGWFVGPTIVADVDPRSSLARDEIFGPVLAVMRAASFEEAVTLANDTDYALTAGVFSRSPAHARMAAAQLRAGNVYVNRGITGAVVGRQPFGGYGLSGVGSKAGGPDYLLQFLDPRAVSENTVRQGFAPSPAPDPCPGGSLR